MRNNILFLLIACMVLSCKPNKPINNNPPVIVTDQKSGSAGNRLRSSGSNYIEGHPAFQSIAIEFSAECGPVQMEFYNLTNGEIKDTVVIGSCISSIPLNLSPGHWKVTFKLSDGKTFTDEFEIIYPSKL